MHPYFENLDSEYSLINIAHIKIFYHAMVFLDDISTSNNLTLASDSWRHVWQHRKLMELTMNGIYVDIEVDPSRWCGCHSYYTYIRPTDYLAWKLKYG